MDIEKQAEAELIIGKEECININERDWNKGRERKRGAKRKRKTITKVRTWKDGWINDWTNRETGVCIDRQTDGMI